MKPSNVKLPITIRVGKHKYSVEVVEAMLRKRDAARIHYGTRRIEIGRMSNTTGKAFSDTQVLDSFWHEVTHAILEEMGRHTLNADERFVTEFANRLTKVIQTAEFK
jgi:hypothetical protein